MCAFIYLYKNLQVLFFYSCVETPQQPVPAPMKSDDVAKYYSRSQSQPRYTTSSVVNKYSRSKTNPHMPGSSYSPRAPSSPKYHRRKISEPFQMLSSFHRVNTFQMESQAVRLVRRVYIKTCTNVLNIPISNVVNVIHYVCQEL